MSEPPAPESVRADVWLWAARFFKTRSVATKMCNAGKVKRAGVSLKPAAALRPGDELEIPWPEGPGIRNVTVTALIERRAAAPVARACFDENTPQETLDERRLWHEHRREAPRGRPTKKDRREINQFRGFFE
ncbi:MAG: RNA-binding S4 domain-containing protein [Akkermansiaceae bacterium]|nr:RNA-binding S4 domain-containing protein [Akkermansiaceae bacterium]